MAAGFLSFTFMLVFIVYRASWVMRPQAHRPPEHVVFLAGHLDPREDFRLCHGGLFYPQLDGLSFSLGIWPSLPRCEPVVGSVESVGCLPSPSDLAGLEFRPRTPQNRAQPSSLPALAFPLGSSASSHSRISQASFSFFPSFF